MADSFLLLSSPPFSKVDAAAVAPYFGVTAAEARVRLNYPVSTIWFANDDLAPLQDIARNLLAQGVATRIIKGRSLSAVANRHRLRRFAFSNNSLRCWVDDKRGLDIPYTWSALSISCRPMATESHERMTVRQAAKAADRNKSARQEAKSPLNRIKDHVDEAFVDFYFFELPKVHRFTARPGDTDFSGLGEDMKPVVRQNIAQLAEQIGKRFAFARHSSAMENLPAPRPMLPDGQPLLPILDRIEAGLSEADPFDLLSRFSFLVSAGRSG